MIARLEKYESGHKLVLRTYSKPDELSDMAIDPIQTLKGFGGPNSIE